MQRGENNMASVNNPTLEKSLTKEQFNGAKLSFMESLSYGFTGFGTNILANMIASFVTFYYTNSVGVAAAVVGTMILLSKLLDGVSDFIMGVIIEKTHTKWGQAKPWLVIGTIPMAISMILLFSSMILLFSCPPSLGDSGKVGWMYFSYIFCNVICYTVVLMSMSSMLVLMTGSTEARTKASAFNQILGSISLIFVSMFTEKFASAYGWFMISTVYAVIAVASMVFALFFCKERHHLIRDSEEKEAKIKAELEAKKEKGSLGRDIKDLVSTKYFWSLIIVTLGKFLATGAATGVAIYFFTDVVGNSAIFGIITMVWFIPPMLVNLGITSLVRKVGGYHKILAIGFFMQTVGWLLEAYAPNMPLLYLGALLVGIGGSNMTLIFPMIGDVVAYGELKYGRALTGLTNSGYSIGNKLGMGLGGAMVGWILSFTGYQGGAAVQTATALSGVRFIFGVIPAAVTLLAAIVSWVCHVERDVKAGREAQAN